MSNSPTNTPSMAEQCRQQARDLMDRAAADLSRAQELHAIADNLDSEQSNLGQNDAQDQ